MRKFKGDERESLVRLGTQVLNESELEFAVEYAGETFTLKYPNHFERSMIEAEISKRLQGMPRASFPPEYITFIQAASYANALLIPEKSPDWIDASQPLWDQYDEDLLYALYRGYLQFREELQRKSKRTGDTKGSS